MRRENPVAEDRAPESSPTTARPMPMVTGCPAGCRVPHECGVGAPIEAVADYSQSAVFVPAQGGVRLMSLRDARAA
jgi:hypothetical protein